MWTRREGFIRPSYSCFPSWGMPEGSALDILPWLAMAGQERTARFLRRKEGGGDVRSLVVCWCLARVCWTQERPQGP